MLKSEVAPDDRRGIAITGGLRTRWTTVRGRRVHWAGEQWRRSPEEAKPECRNKQETTHCGIYPEHATTTPSFKEVRPAPAVSKSAIAAEGG